VDAVSVVQSLDDWARTIDALLTKLTTENNELADWTRQHGLMPVTSATPYRWSPLELHGKQLQSRMYEEYERFEALVEILVRGQPERVGRELEAASRKVLRLIERGDVATASAADAIDEARLALHLQVQLVNSLHSAHEGLVLVPDTNALYWNPALETWRAPDWSRFAIALTPTVLRELDTHKADDRNASRQQKAERLIRQIGEYRRRGRLVDGVPLVRDVSTIFAIATEARMADSLTWLDPGNADDRFFASALEVMRSNVRAAVTIVTRDVNLQNKIEFARLLFLAPSSVAPEAESRPAKPSKKRRVKR
jgi:hypothetical protein